jgi:hypothetical protein
LATTGAENAERRDHHRGVREKPACLVVDDLEAAADDVRHAGFIVVDRKMLDVAFDMVAAQIARGRAIKETVDSPKQRHVGHAASAR